MRTSRLTLATLAVGLSAACSGGDSEGPSEGGGAPAGDIIVRNNFFDPATFAADVGSEVVWAWSEGAVLHDVVFEDDAPGSGARSSGTFSRTFTAPGEYPYFCAIHGASAMSGVVNVGSAGGEGPGSGGGDGSGDGGGGGGGTPGGSPYGQGTYR